MKNFTFLSKSKSTYFCNRLIHKNVPSTEYSINHLTQLMISRYEILSGQLECSPHCSGGAISFHPMRRISHKIHRKRRFYSKRASGSIRWLPVASGFHRNLSLSQHDRERERKSLSKISAESLPVTQNPTGSFSTLLLSLPAGGCVQEVRYYRGLSGFHKSRVLPY